MIPSFSSISRLQPRKKGKFGDRKKKGGENFFEPESIESIRILSLVVMVMVKMKKEEMR